MLNDDAVTRVIEITHSIKDYAHYLIKQGCCGYDFTKDFEEIEDRADRLLKVIKENDQ